MTMGAGVAVLAAQGGDLLERWRDLGPALWVVAGGLAVVWLVVLGLLTALTEPRRVRPGAAALEVQGTERPAVVNLVTTDWELGHEAIPATLVDLAARRYVEIDLVGDRTVVQVRTHRAQRAGDHLTRYEAMVLDHVRRLAGQTGDGRVPAEALTTGPDETARSWWKNFRSAVVNDARSRRLSRPRWTSARKAVLIAAAAPVALALALAVSTLPDDPDDPDDDPASGALWAGVVCFVGLSGVAGSRSGERDTPEGRVAAARWFGLRDVLEEDPLFAEQPPAAVAIWDHLLAHGTALGVAHGVVQALPLGAESEREAWSSVGDRWRVVRVRYPRRLPPGYGRHPALVLLLGLVQLAIGIPLLPMAHQMATAVRDSLDAGSLGGADVGADVPPAVYVGVAVVAAIVTVLAAGVAVRGAAMTLVALADLVTGRATIEGRVLRVRDRSTDKQVIWYLAVDDGTADRVRAWRFRSRGTAAAGATVRGRVTRRLQHVADLEIVGPAAAAPATAAEAATAAMAGATAGGEGSTPAPPPLPDDAAISA
ncbi:MAG TPA: hypothetical protein VF015_14240, partial [Acidimicrobiales bacterium]